VPKKQIDHALRELHYYQAYISTLQVEQVVQVEVGLTPQDDSRLHGVFFELTTRGFPAQSSYKVLAIGGRYDHRIDEFRSRWHYPPFGKRAVGAELSVGAIAVQMQNAGVFGDGASGSSGGGGSAMPSQSFSQQHDTNGLHAPPPDTVVVALVKASGGGGSGGGGGGGQQQHGRIKPEIQHELCKLQLLALRKLWGGGFTAVVLYGTKTRKQLETHSGRIGASFLVTFRESSHESRTCVVEIVDTIRRYPTDAGMGSETTVDRLPTVIAGVTRPRDEEMASQLSGNGGDVSRVTGGLHSRFNPNIFLPEEGGAKRKQMNQERKRHGALFSTEICTRGCHWFPHLLA
jgi:histidyl-tRNA synthetase